MHDLSVCVAGVRQASLVPGVRNWNLFWGQKVKSK